MTASTMDEFTAGYTLGFESGHDVGYRRGVADEGAAWTAIFTGCAETWRRPEYAELQQRRRPTNEPCRTRCGRCSSCIRAQAVHRNRERYGCDDFPGLDALSGAA